MLENTTLSPSIYCTNLSTPCFPVGAYRTQTSCTMPAPSCPRALSRCPVLVSLSRAYRSFQRPSTDSTSVARRKLGSVASAKSQTFTQICSCTPTSATKSRHTLVATRSLPHLRNFSRAHTSVATLRVRLSSTTHSIGSLGVASRSLYFLSCLLCCCQLFSCLSTDSILYTRRTCASHTDMVILLAAHKRSTGAHIRC